MSKFDYSIFCGGYDELAVSKQRYTKEEAVKIAGQEFEGRKHKYLFCGDGYARHRAGINEDGEPCVGWWLEYREHKRSCPCWVFHTGNETRSNFYGEYKEFELHKSEERRN